MEYEGHVIRPPSEADSIILQVTVGCSHNRCFFCGAYRDVSFRIKKLEELQRDLAFAAQHCGRLKRVFLADGDVLSLSQRRLREIFLEVRRMLPWIRRIGLYGNAKNIRHKSLEDLQELRTLGLDRVYMGLESGHDEVLKAINKGVDANTMIAAGQKVRKAGLFLSVTVLLGIGGVELSLEHAKATGRVLSSMQPSQIAVLSLMLLPGTPLWDLQQQGLFQLPTAMGLLNELRELVRHTEVPRALFHANHASNYLPIDARLPADRDRILSMLDLALMGAVPLVPEYCRSL